MLTNDTNPPEMAPAGRKELLRYMERFGRWARKLDDTDLSMVVAFCANVQMAWSDGQAKKVEEPTAAEQVAEGAVPIALPGLCAPFEDAQVSDLAGDDNASN
jgi:hypothetical protein